MGENCDRSQRAVQFVGRDGERSALLFVCRFERELRLLTLRDVAQHRDQNALARQLRRGGPRVKHPHASPRHLKFDLRCLACYQVMANLPADKVVRRQAKQVRGGVIAEPDGPAAINGHDAIGRCCQGYPNHVVRGSCVGLGWIVAVSVGGRAEQFTHQPAGPATCAIVRQIRCPQSAFRPRNR